MPAHHQIVRTRASHLSLSIACAAVLVFILTLAACGATPGGTAAPYTASTNWHDITPPTADSIASYAISPDVPGLIVACTGGKTGNMSASPLGPATLWRTRDGGAHWQRLAASGYIAGCQVAFPAGGNGTLFALNVSGSQLIQVSHDAGDTWKTVAEADGSAYGGLQQRFTLLAHGVYRDGKLYTSGQAGTPAADSASATATASSLNPSSSGVSIAGENVGLVFSVSTDDSQTWTAVEAIPDPLIQQGYIPLAIAADYSAPGAWYRLWGLAYSSSPGSSAILEHSADNGRTWQGVTLLGERGYYTGVGDGGPGTAMLATVPSQPNRICAALIPLVFGQTASTSSSSLAFGANAASGSTLTGLPAPTPHDVILFGSDNGGHHWNGGTIGTHRIDYGGAAGPSVAMDPAGNCYLADVASQGGDTTHDIATIWRQAPGLGATPANIARLTGQSIGTFAISLDSATHAPRLVAVTYVYTGPTEVNCQGNTCPPEPNQPSPHLIWTPAP